MSKGLKILNMTADLMSKHHNAPKPLKKNPTEAAEDNAEDNGRTPDQEMQEDANPNGSPKKNTKDSEQASLKTLKKSISAKKA